MIRRGLYHSVVHSYPAYPAANAAAARVPSLHEALLQDARQAAVAKATAAAVAQATQPSHGRRAAVTAALASFTCGALTAYATFYTYASLSL